MKINSNKVFCAFYDFSISRVSFDYFGFLVLAEFERQNQGKEILHLILVPAEGDGFHPNVLYDLKQKQWRVRNIIMPGLALVPALTQLTVCSSRDQAREIFINADKPVFPEDYTPDMPVGKWHASWSTLYAALNRDIQVLRSPPQALQYIENWANKLNVGKGIVSITLRNASFNDQKNTDVQIWAEVAHGLKANGYLPIIIPDTETALLDRDEHFKNLRFMPEASVNLELRMALYEYVFLNLFVSNGPSVLCYYNKFSKYIQFVSGDYLLDKTKTEDDFGSPFGFSQPWSNHFQKMVWEEHTVENILSEFKIMALKIENAKQTNNMGQFYEKNPENAISLVESLRLFFRSGKWEPFDEAARELVKKQTDLAETYYLVGLAEKKQETSSEKGLTVRAEEAFESAVRIGLKEINDGNYTSTLCEAVSRSLQLLGKRDEAQRFLEGCINEEPGFLLPYKLLAKIYVSSGKSEQAIECYLKALEIGITEVELYSELGQIFTDLGMLENAIGCFQHIIALGSKDKEVFLKLGLLHEAQNNLKAAIVAYEMAIKFDNKDPRINYRLNTLLQQERDVLL